MKFDDTDTPDLSEDALRQALDRLGQGTRRPATHRPSSPRPASDHRPSAQGSHHGSGSHFGGSDPGQRRRRFVQDGDVPVERHTLTRAPRTQGLPPPTDDHQAEVERLRESVRREQRLREDTERSLSEARSMARTLETRAGHAEVRLDEARADAARHEQTIAQLHAQLRALEAERDRLLDDRQTLEVRLSHAAPAAPSSLATIEAPVRVAPRRVARPAVATMDVDFETDEPEPVKWWIKKKA
ncbi:hypothetical protein AA103196_2798 [Ameyamaea chiangmaiensis NBRC 103196]|nr:hypothetical protein [Ameyamaea chiangmaiensis]MBS4074288.1 hypothetical protein [Ameyamaea chiangmaiensis]GBQ71519.1 hypothetical protein AA103196_2798 [Ameyamaea chiangmaiensis NBRC 103196]